MGGSAVTNKPKPKKWQVGSGGDTHLSNNVSCYITQYPPFANQNTPSETPPVDAQTTNKTHHMDPKSPKFSLCSERTGVQYRNRGRGKLIDICPWYYRNSSSYSDTIYTGSTTHTYTKESTVIETGVVRVTLSLENVTATTNGIRFK